MNPAIITASLDANVPLILWGEPGTGKTAFIRSFYADHHMEVLIGSTMDPCDVTGMPLPDVDKTRVRWAPPEWAIRVRDALDDGKRAILFLDELSCAPSSVQAALLRVVHERRIGDIVIPECRIIAASNPPETAADNGFFSAAMSSRFAHMQWSVDTNAWIRGELGGWGKTRSLSHAKYAAQICDFIHRNPATLSPERETMTMNTNDPWPCPRSWSAAITMIACTANREDHQQLLVSCVGTAAANECIVYLNNLDLPDPDELLSGAAALPKRNDQIFASLGSLVAVALLPHVNRLARVKTAWGILAKVRPDIALTAARVLVDECPEVTPDEASALGARITKLGI